MQRTVFVAIRNVAASQGQMLGMYSISVRAHVGLITARPFAMCTHTMSYIYISYSVAIPAELELSGDVNIAYASPS